MLNPAITELTALAASFDDSYAVLVARARAVAEHYGIEVIDLRPGADGMWDVRLRLPAGGARAREASPPAAATPQARFRRPPPKPFVSPVIRSRPFDGDGTGDLDRFFAEADRSVRVPPHGRPGSAPVRLGEEERLRMLADVIAGDVLLSLQHQGLHGDVRAVDAALRHARTHYEAEIMRAGMESRMDEFLALYEPACAAVRGELLGNG
ncbi:hypothetical protein [Longimicrobium sp.]|uniref:hypothetical protein n=1 Tax=Longimicrobium sp. TaxID=2029185 RepID=UPI002E358A1C|nr:hypothetical protein [Longimicrobium sp.]HEX6038591.1 hypothetical protein [Longimicrobium sp.]